MEKMAIIFGNKNGLPSVEKDCNRIEEFLRSPLGGCWIDDEILYLPFEITADELNEIIVSIKQLNLDYVFVYFSGHGGSRSQQTILEINSNEEKIYLRELLHLSQRQLTIVDCCRYPCDMLNEEEFSLKKSIKQESSRMIPFIRESFDKRLSQALPQNVIVYSCSYGEYSDDLGNGSRFTNALLDSLYSVDKQYKLVSEVFIEAADVTSESSEYSQNPKLSMPKISPQYQIPLSINPNSFVLHSKPQYFPY